MEKALRVLGLPPGAQPGEIRNAYRRLAFEYHPDRHAGQPEMESRFKEIGEAYRALTAEAPDSERASPPAPLQKGRDLHYDIQVDFMTAAAGGEVSVRIRRPFVCAMCEGRNSKGCPECQGEGFVAEEAMVSVLLPSGLDDGESVRFPFEGAPGTGGGGPGDLILTVRSLKHPGLIRRGLDVMSEVMVPRFRLERGGPVRVFTVRGGAQVNIPPGTRSGRKMRLRGWGIHRTRDGRTFKGDHVVRIIEMPGGYDKP
jgi:DnaJ-class molecular chaperone